MELGMLPTQELGLVLSLAAWCVFTVALVVARKVNGQASASLRLALAGLWLYATLRLYSASAFLWGVPAADAKVLPVLRMLVLGALTLVVIIGITLLAWYWRRWRSKR